MSLEGETKQKNLVISEPLQERLSEVSELSSLSESEILRLGALLAGQVVENIDARHLGSKYKIRNKITTSRVWEIDLTADQFEASVFQ